MRNLDVLDPFRTVLPHDADDDMGAIVALAQREALIESTLRGESSLDDTLDCLSDQGIDPDRWLAAVVENVDYVISEGIQFASNERGLFLPVK